MAQFFSDFSKDTVGEMPSGFSLKRNSTPNDYTVVSRNSRQELQFLRTGATQSSRGLAVADVPSSGWTEIYAQVRDLGSNPNSARLVVYATETPENEYGAQFQSPGLTLYSRSNGAYKSLTTATYTPSTGYYNIRFRVVPYYTIYDRLLQMKVWSVDDEEPNDWRLSTVTRDIPADEGWVGLVGFANNAEVFYSKFGVGTDGDPAPTEPLPEAPTRKNNQFFFGANF